MVSLVITGGRVVDPASGMDAIGDVAVVDGRISADGNAALLLGAVLGALLTSSYADWDLPTLGLLLAFAIASDLMAASIRATKMKVSGSFLAIVVAMVLLGGAPAAAIGVLAVITGAIKDRKPGLIPPNAAIYASFPLACGAMFHWAKDSWSLQPHDVAFVAVVLALFAVALGMNFLLVASYGRVTAGHSIRVTARHALVPLLTTDLIAAVMELSTGLV